MKPSKVMALIAILTATLFGLPVQGMCAPAPAPAPSSQPQIAATPALTCI